MCQFPRLRINCLETYKRIVRNATESPLLRLPPATSNQIWREVSGDRLVHISCYLPGENNDITGDGDQNTAEKEPMEKWTRLVCKLETRDTNMIKTC